MNSQRLVPDNQIYPFVRTVSIRPLVDNYAYRPAGYAVTIPNPTYKSVQTNGSVSYITERKFQTKFTTINNTPFFKNSY
jgi:hypothetical protein